MKNPVNPDDKSAEKELDEQRQTEASQKEYEAECLDDLRRRNGERDHGFFGYWPASL